MQKEHLRYEKGVGRIRELIYVIAIEIVQSVTQRSRFIPSCKQKTKKEGRRPTTDDFNTILIQFF